MNSRLYRNIVLGIAVVSISLCYYFLTRAKPPVEKSYAGIMNTRLRMEIVGRTETADADLDSIAAELEVLDKTLNRFNPESEISRISAQAGKRPVRVSNATLHLVEVCQDISVRTGGAFDATIGPLVDLWQIFPSSRVDDTSWKPPEQAAINAARRLVGSNNIVLDHGQATVFLRKPGMSLDVGGIAKGYALDVAAARLNSLGLSNYLIELGGDIYAAGKRADGKPWKIGILNPRKPTDIIASLDVSNMSVSTSGDYESSRTYMDARYTHIFDPPSGNPARGLASVTILSPSATEADALSTAAFVLGPEEGLKLIENWPNADGVFIDSTMRIFTTTRLKGKVQFK